jgi:hypothetical protein
MPLAFIPLSPVRFAAEEVVTWIKVDKPELDIVGLILGAFSLTGALVLLAMALGVAFGVTLIYRRRHEPAPQPPLDIQSR